MCASTFRTSMHDKFKMCALSSRSLQFRFKGLQIWHRNLGKMANILQTKLLNAFSRKNLPLWSKFHSSLFLQLTLNPRLRYTDVIVGAIASQIISLTIVYSTVYSDAYQRKHQSSASLAFVWGIHRGPVNSPHKGPVTRKMFPLNDVIMGSGSGWAPNKRFQIMAYRLLCQTFGKIYTDVPMKCLLKGLDNVLINIFYRCITFYWITFVISVMRGPIIDS